MKLTKVLSVLLVTIFLTASCGSSKKYSKNPNRHKSKGACGVNVRY